MDIVHNHVGPMSGCGCCSFSRRKFLAKCTACAAGATGLAALPGKVRAGNGAKPRVRLVFSHTTPDQITWPNIGYDYEGHKRNVTRQLARSCPNIEFLPVWIKDAAEAKRVMEADAEVDAYLVDMVGMKGGGATLIQALGKAGRPTVLIDNLFAGGGNFLTANTNAKRLGWNVVGLATSRFDDVAEVARCFSILKQPGKTVDDFLVVAERVRRKNIAPVGDMTCVEDLVPIGDVGECARRLRESTILVVGQNSLSSDAIIGAIGDVFGTKVVQIDFPVLHEAYLKADRDEAAMWADRWIGEAEKVVEPTRRDIVGAGAMYLAMRGLMRTHGAQAVAVHCLGGFYGGFLKAYPCLGFAQLNNDGLVGACEADLRSTITMLALGYLTGRPGFISDPVIDTAQNQIIYAHCVAPSKVFGPDGASNPFHIRSHSEDRQGAAIRSLMPLGYLTSSLKFDPGQRETVFHQAKTVANVDLDQACRTKLAAEVKGDIDKLLSGWNYGWHRVTCYGDLKEPIRELSETVGLKLVEEV